MHIFLFMAFNNVRLWRARWWRWPCRVWRTCAAGVPPPSTRYWRAETSSTRTATCTTDRSPRYSPSSRFVHVFRYDCLCNVTFNRCYICFLLSFWEAYIIVRLQNCGKLQTHCLDKWYYMREYIGDIKEMGSDLSNKPKLLLCFKTLYIIFINFSSL